MSGYPRRQTDGERLAELIRFAEDILAAVRPDLPQETRQRQASRLLADHLLRTAT